MDPAVRVPFLFQLCDSWLLAFCDPQRCGGSSTISNASGGRQLIKIIRKFGIYRRGIRGTEALLSTRTQEVGSFVPVVQRFQKFIEIQIRRARWSFREPPPLANDWIYQACIAQVMMSGASRFLFCA
jgi:hypothetical protein